MPIAPLDGDRAEIEEDERLVRPVLQLFAEDPRIAFELSGSQGEVDVARVPDDQVGPPDGNPGSAEGGHDLLVNAIGPAEVLPDREQPDMVDDGLAAAAVGAGIAGASHDVSRRLVRPQSREELPELLPLGRVDHVVGIEPEGVNAGGVGERLIPRRGEVVDPGELEHVGSELLGDLDRPIARPGIDDDALIEDPADRFQALRQVLLLVFQDQGQGDFRPPSQSIRGGFGAADRRGGTRIKRGDDRAGNRGHRGDVGSTRKGIITEKSRILTGNSSIRWSGCRIRVPSR